MKKSLEDIRKKLDEEWNKIKSSLYVGSRPEDDSVDWVIDELKKQYQLPIKKNQ